MAVHIGDAEIDVRADLSGVQADVDKGIKKSLSGVEDDFDKSGKKAGGKFAGAMGGVLAGGALVGVAKILGDGLAEAAEAAQIGAIIDQALANAGSASRGLTKAAFSGIAEDIAKSLVVDDDDIAKGLAPLLRIPELTKPAFDQLAQIAADTAAGTGKDLESISGALSRLATAPDDAIGALRGLGVQVTDSTRDVVKGLVEQGDSAGALQVILDELSGRYAGAAKAAGDAAGPQQKLDLAMSQLKESIGTALIPIISKLAAVITPIARAFTNLPGPVQAIIVGLGLLAGAAAVLAPIITAIGAALPIVGGALAAIVSPIGLVVAAIVGLGIVIFIFRDDILKALKAVAGFFADAFAAVVDFVQKWGFVLLGPIGVIFHFRDEILGALRAVVGFFGDLIGDVIDFAQRWGFILAGPIGVIFHFRDEIIGAFESLVSFVTGLPGRIASAAGGMFDPIKEAFRSAVNFVIRGWNSLDFTLPSVTILGKKFGGFTLGTPDITPLAKGGIVSGPTLALVGEGSQPEVVAPLDRLEAIIRSAIGMSTGQTINVNVSGVGIDEVAEMVARRVSLTLGMAAGL